MQQSDSTIERWVLDVGPSAFVPLVRNGLALAPYPLAHRRPHRWRNLHLRRCDQGRRPTSIRHRYRQLQNVAVGDRRSTGLLLAVAGISLRLCSYPTVLLPRGIVYFNGAHLHLHRRKYHRKGAGARHYLRLFRSREQELELHYPSRVRFRDSHCSGRALGFKPRATTRIVGRRSRLPHCLDGNRERLPYNAIVPSNPPEYAVAYVRREDAFIHDQKT